MTQQVIVTVRHTDTPPLDLALPYDIPCQVVAQAVAQVIGLPVGEDQQYMFTRVRGKEHKVIAPTETFGEAHISYGEYLEIAPQTETTIQSATGAILRLSNGHKVPLVGQTTLLGRKTPVSNVDLDLAEVDDARVVSKKHATIYFEEGKYTLRDHSSTNGTCINNHRLIPDNPFELHSGDEIELGGPKGVKLTFVENQ